MRGEINISDKTADVQATLKDTYGNESHVRVKVIPEKQEGRIPFNLIQNTSVFEINSNVLTLQVRPCAPKSKIVLYEKGSAVAVDPAYENYGQQVFLIDLKKMIPDSAQACNGIIRFDVADQIPSKAEHSFFSDWADIRFHKNSLYDTLYLNISRSVKNTSEVFSIGRDTEPLNDSIEITLKQIAHGVNDSKVSVYYRDGRVNEFVGGTWENGSIKFTTRKLGNFVVLKDSIPPFIYRIYCNSVNARFRITDNLSGIAKYEATINGEWLLMKYDYKTGALQSDRLDKTKPMKGDFELKVVDRAGNEKIYKQKIL
jgi:hypothetical protein